MAHAHSILQHRQLLACWGTAFLQVTSFGHFLILEHHNQSSRSSFSSASYDISIDMVQASILPVIVTNHTVTIAAQLENSTTLVGQCEISHPVSSGPPELSLHAENGTRLEAEHDGEDVTDGIETHDISTRNVTFSKAEEHDDAEAALPSPISRQSCAYC
jgi:hypothetical protein